MSGACSRRCGRRQSWPRDGTDLFPVLLSALWAIRDRIFCLFSQLGWAVAHRPRRQMPEEVDVPSEKVDSLPLFQMFMP